MQKQELEDLHSILSGFLNFCKVTNNRKELIIRCPYCGDSSDRSHGHFYIKNQPPFPAICHRCGYRTSYLSTTLLKDLEIYDGELLSYSQKLKKNIKFEANFKGRSLNSLFSKYPIKNNQEYKKRFKSKVDYLNKRLGVSLSFEEYVNDFKIIFDLGKLFVDNSLERYHNLNDKGMVNLLREMDTYGIGFLSVDNSHINFRNISPNCKYRYYMFNIFNTSDEAMNTYTIPNIIDILEDSEIILTEGPFDLLGVLLHIYNGKMGNNIFSTVSGKYYKRAILYLYRMGFIDSNINIYSDADVKKEYFKRLKGEIFQQNIDLYYNSIDKDFGVPKEKIKVWRQPV